MANRMIKTQDFRDSRDTAAPKKEVSESEKRTKRESKPRYLRVTSSDYSWVEGGIEGAGSGSIENETATRKHPL
jgi:hypothetical protein